MKMKNLCVSWVLSDTRNICPFQGTGRGAQGIVGVMCGASQRVHVKEKLSSHQFKRGGSETWVREMNSSHTARRTEAILWITEVSLLNQFFWPRIQLSMINKGPKE